MPSLNDVLAKINEADLFFGAKVDSVHTERPSGETALHICAKWGDAEAIGILLNNGAEINKRGEDENTPLHYAAMLGNFEAVRCLLDAGAMNLEDIYGNTAKQLASEHSNVKALLEAHGF